MIGLEGVVIGSIRAISVVAPVNMRIVIVISLVVVLVLVLVLVV